MNFFQADIMVGIVSFDKCIVIVIFSLKFWLKYFCKTVSIICCGCFLSSKYSFNSFNWFFLLLVTILLIRFANDINIVFFMCGG